MTEEEGRKRLVEVALTWERTPFLWEGAIKGVGTDCGRFLACVANEAGLRNIDLDALPRLPWNWFLHHGDNSYLDIIKSFAYEYERHPFIPPQPGDVVVVQYGLDWAHSAYVVQWPRVIGAAAGGEVMQWKDINLSPHFGSRKRKFFSLWKKNV